MPKRLSREEKIQNCIIELINEMFIIAGHEVTYDDVKGRKDNWFQEWTMTESQYHDWQTWGTEHIRKSLKFSKEMAKREMSMVGLMWGLKFQR